jgi:hypothetical protein
MDFSPSEKHEELSRQLILAENCQEFNLSLTEDPAAASKYA